MKHKESFSQKAYQGVPAHIVVQYWDNEENLCAAYFDNWKDAEEFEEGLETP